MPNGYWPASTNAMFGIQVKKTGRIKKPRLDAGPLTKIGNRMVSEQKKRWAQGINAEGNQAKPLSMKYMFIKQKFTGVHRPIRDNKMTGDMVANFTLRKAIENTIRAENTSRLGRLHAQRSQSYEEMIGFAGSDQMVVFRTAEAAYGDWMQKAWVPIG